MRSVETRAVTITLPKALYEAVRELAERDHCGNVSAVIRQVLYKEAGVSGSLELKESALARIQDAEMRSVNYSQRPKKKSAGSSSKRRRSAQPKPTRPNRPAAEAS